MPIFLCVGIYKVALYFFFLSQSTSVALESITADSKHLNYILFSLPVHFFKLGNHVLDDFIPIFFSHSYFSIPNCIAVILYLAFVIVIILLTLHIHKESVIYTFLLSLRKPNFTPKTQN